MKRNIIPIILTGIIVILAAVIVGMLIFLNNQPPQVRATQPLVEIKKNEPDSEQWGLNYPNQYDSLIKTAINTADTAYGGSSGFSWLERDPRLKMLFAGMPFSKEYNDDRGHEWALEDVNNTARVNEKTPGSCYACKSANNPALWEEMGLAEYSRTPFKDLGNHIDETIGCANCHEAGTMRLILTNPAVIKGFEDQGIDWKTFSRQEMRTMVCANCHVEYFFAGEGKLLTNPWKLGTSVEQIYQYYEEIGFKDWEYPDTLTPMLKAQHPEFEFYSAGSTHYNAGVSCADCHMPYVRDGAAKYSMHDIHSPMLNPELSCGTCHTDVEYVVSRVSDIQDKVNKAKVAAEDAIIDAVAALKAASTHSASDAAALEKARGLHRKAQYLWDFVAAENSTGFHNPEYALSILAEAANLARQSQMLAAQSVNDPSLLTVGVYYQQPPTQ